MNKIQNVLSKYSNHFKVEIDDEMDITMNEQKYPFVDASDGILVCDPQDYNVVGGYGGLTYIFGAVSVYTYQLERVKWDGMLWYLFENRIIHEILHHFNKDCHGLDAWLKKNNPFLYLLYHLTGCNGEGFIGSRCERMYYETLMYDVNEEQFNKDNRISDRNYKGVLENE